MLYILGWAEVEGKKSEVFPTRFREKMLVCGIYLGLLVHINWIIDLKCLHIDTTYIRGIIRLSIVQVLVPCDHYQILTDRLTDRLTD